MIVIAQRDDEEVYLVSLVLEPENDMEADGFIVDMEKGERYPTMNVHSLMARGYWDEFEDTGGDEDRILAFVESQKSEE